MKKEGQFASTVNRVFFHDGESFGQVIFFLEIFHKTIGVQMMVRQQVLHQYAPDIEPYLGPGVMGIGIVVVVGAGVKDVGRPCAQSRFPVTRTDISSASCAPAETMTIKAMNWITYAPSRVGITRSSRSMVKP